jgi:hypothetical protein
MVIPIGRHLDVGAEAAPTPAPHRDQEAR